MYLWKKRRVLFSGRGVWSLNLLNGRWGHGLILFNTAIICVVQKREDHPAPRHAGATTKNTLSWSGLGSWPITKKCFRTTHPKKTWTKAATQRKLMRNVSWLNHSKTKSWLKLGVQDRHFCHHSPLYALQDRNSRFFQPEHKAFSQWSFSNQYENVCWLT